METKRSFFVILLAAMIILVGCQGKSTSPAMGSTQGASDENVNPTSSTMATARNASVAYLEGTVTQDGVTLAIGDEIRDGALIQTDLDGLAEIVFEDKNAIRIGPSASLRVHLAVLEKSLDIERGTVTAVLRKLDKLAGGKLDVNTPSLVAGVRGTSFCVWVSGKTDETYFCTCNGRIEFIPGGTEESIIEEANHHEALVFTGSGDGVRVVPAPADMDPRHGDADLESLASRIGEKMDWSHVEK